MHSDTLRQATHPMAQFDGLALDTTDPDRAAGFWQVALGGRAVTGTDKKVRVRPGPGRPAREILRLRAVDLPGGDDGARVHVDLRLPGAEPDQLLAAGARLVRAPGIDPWYVLADPEGNQFCAFPAVDDRPPGMFQLVVKCSRPHRLARWWAEVLGGRAVDEGDAAAVIGAPEFPWDYMAFDRVPDAERNPSRIRWHLVTRDREILALVAAGARVLSRPVGTDPWLLADPGGNEFYAHVAHIPAQAQSH